MQADVVVDDMWTKHSYGQYSKTKCGRYAKTKSFMFRGGTLSKRVGRQRTTCQRWKLTKSQQEHNSQPLYEYQSTSFVDSLWKSALTKKIECHHELNYWPFDISAKKIRWQCVKGCSDKILKATESAILNPFRCRSKRFVDNLWKRCEWDFALLL